MVNLLICCCWSRAGFCRDYAVGALLMGNHHLDIALPQRSKSAINPPARHGQGAPDESMSCGAVSHNLLLPL